jgi:histidine triad (HIT) family protein
MDPNCLFCKIIAGQIPSKKAFEDKYTFAFHDIAPKAPTHILVVPREHYSGIHEIPADKMGIIEKIFSSVNAIVRQEKLLENGYRLVVNFGKQAGQAVPHIHVHILGGRDMHWPPG